MKTKQDLDQFCLAEPPTEEQFRQIGEFLIARLESRFQERVEIVEQHIEK